LLLGLIVAQNAHKNVFKNFKHRKLVKNLCLYLSLDKIVEIKFFSSPPPHWYTLSTCPAKSGGLGRPPPVRELPMLCPLIKREHSHWGRPPMTHNSKMLCKKINYRLNRLKLDNVRVSKYS
jgi:hypothetical protein